MIIYWIAGGGLVSTVIYGMLLFDRLVRWQYRNHRQQWISDGKPDGFFWRAKECESWSSDLAKKKLQISWMFVTPNWALAAPECRRWLTQSRFIFVIVLVALLLGIVRFVFQLILR
jgi:hypothetical protein